MGNQQLNVPDLALNIPSDRAGNQAVSARPKHSKKGLILGLVLGLVLVLAGGTYVAARFGYITLPFPLPGTANDVIVKSLDALYNTSASESTSEFSIEIAPRDSSIPTLFPSTSNTLSTSDNSGSIGLGNSRLASAGTMFELIPDNLSIIGSSTSYSEKTAGTGKADATMKFKLLAGETNVDADLNIRLLEENVFVKINTLRGIPNFDATDALGKWFTANVADAGNAARGFELIPENANADKALKESRQTIEQVLDLAQKHQLFTTKKNFGKETIEGVSTRHTSHMLNPKQVVPFFEDLIATRKKAGQDVNGADDMVAEIKKTENLTVLENFSKALTVDLWYDGLGKMMKKIILTMVIVPPTESVKYKSSQFVLTFSTTLKSSGQKKALAAPTGAEPMEKLLLTPNPIDGSSNISSHDAQRKSDLAMIRTALALYYDDNNRYPAALQTLVPAYVAELSVDPVTKSAYEYEICEPSHFLLIAKLDGAGGPWYVNDQGGPKRSTAVIACGTAIISNSNISLNTNVSLNTNTSLSNTNTGTSYDTDGDSISDVVETSLYHSDPNKIDTDGDGLEDGEEILGWITAIDPTGKFDSELYLTEIAVADTDGDGYSDLAELCNGYVPDGPGKMQTELNRRPKHCPE